MFWYRYGRQLGVPVHGTKFAFVILTPPLLCGRLQSLSTLIVIEAIYRLSGYILIAVFILLTFLRRRRKVRAPARTLRRMYEAQY